MDVKNRLQLQQAPRQHVHATQKLMLLPHMQQAFVILQMPIMELAELVLHEMEQNPLLDMASMDNEAHLEEAVEERTSDKLHELDLEDPSFMMLRNLDEEFSTHLTQTEDFGHSRSREEAQYQLFLDSLIVAQEDPFAALMAQLRERFQDPDLVQCAEILLGYLDEYGYIDTPLEDIALLHDIPLTRVTDVLLMLQELEPAGIGARSLQESLLIQLKRNGKEGGLAWKMVSEEWDNLLHRRIPILAKTFHMTCEEIEQVIHDDVRPLQIHPFSKMQNSPAMQLIPDVTLRYEEEEEAVRITINEESLPPLLIQPQYRKLIQECASHNSPMHQFVRTHFSNLKWLTKMLHQRNQTLFRITLYLAEKQRAFFTSQETHMHPMTMQEVANALELHESTIARAVVNKYIDSPRGLMPLRAFFTYGYSGPNGTLLSSSAIFDAIQTLIHDEDKQHPLSDAKLASLLQERGMTCARRTVAKHRGTLGIGNVQQRRHYHASPPRDHSVDSPNTGDTSNRRA